MHMQRMHEEQTQVEGYNSELQPDTRVFNLVIEAWSKIKGGTKASATRAMRILDLMQELHFQSANDSWQGVVLSKVQPHQHSIQHFFLPLLLHLIFLEVVVTVDCLPTLLAVVEMFHWVPLLKTTRIILFKIFSASIGAST